MTFSNNPEKLSLFGGGCNENDRILDLYGRTKTFLKMAIAHVDRGTASHVNTVSGGALHMQRKIWAAGPRPIFKIFSLDQIRVDQENKGG